MAPGGCLPLTTRSPRRRRQWPPAETPGPVSLGVAALPEEGWEPLCCGHVPKEMSPDVAPTLPGDGVRASLLAAQLSQPSPSQVGLLHPAPLHCSCPVSPAPQPVCEEARYIAKDISASAWAGSSARCPQPPPPAPAPACAGTAVHPSALSRHSSAQLAPAPAALARGSAGPRSDAFRREQRSFLLQQGVV